MDVMSDGPWAGIGLDGLAGRVLEYLVGQSSADAATVATMVGAARDEVDRALRSLEDALLAMPVGGRPPRWKAGPPRSSLGSLLARRRAELADAERYLEQLHEIYDSTARPQHLVEVIEDAGEVSARYTHLLKASTREVLHLAKPPYVTGPSDNDVPQQGSARLEFQAGIRLRSVYDAEGFTDTVSLETALRGSADGGELRLSSRVPVKLVLFDRTTALLPLHEDRPSAGSLVVHSPAVVGALVALFENLWEQAVPVSLESREDWPVPRRSRETTRIDDRTQAILDLMATGMKDDAIARVLDISRRTVQKHVSEAGAALGARTRFQIALRAAERGWLKLEPPVQEPDGKGPEPGVL
ncbi:helix-turn-helix transcriptional regulator [Streptomyces brasiliensis]|uniref:HTH luxR-type domain-containing protein n=1 Tax=Streptomyces brasiliensis TaxID=1954 RepID=A0A917P3V9_9ACTN|nr:LuxR family transcriptional regulator [Streptomyces brasiliensis]GGJ60342.1 hypothetical protein GCM10010121_083690 [Streptomyces brasiliensis]